MGFSFSQAAEEAKLKEQQPQASAVRPTRAESPVFQTPMTTAGQAAATVLPGSTIIDPLSSPDAEFELCGWLLRTTESNLEEAERILERVRDNDMAHPVYRTILAGARSLVTKGEVAGATAILDYAAINNQDIGGAEHLASLITDPVGAAADFDRIEQDADIIIEYSTKRRVRAMLQERLNDLPLKSVKDVVTALSDDVTRMQSDAEQMRTGPRHISEVMGEALEGMLTEGKPAGVYSVGYPEIDKKLNGGLRDGELIVLGARPAMGKTGICMGIGRNMSFDQSHRRHVLFFSLEMTDVALATRALSAESAVPAQLLKNGELVNNAQCMQAIQDVLGRFGALESLESTNSRLWIDSTPGLSLAEIRSRARQFARKYGPPIIIVDYLQIVGQTQRLNGAGPVHESQTNAVGLISQGLKSLARELNTPVLALSQLNRSLESRTNKQPIVSDLRESGNIEQDADIIMFLYRDVVYNPDTPDPDEALLIIAKQREGELGPISLGFNAPLVRFESRMHMHAASAAH